MWGIDCCFGRWGALYGCGCFAHGVSLFGVMFCFGWDVFFGWYDVCFVCCWVVFLFVFGVCCVVWRGVMCLVVCCLLLVCFVMVCFCLFLCWWDVFSVCCVW